MNRRFFLRATAASAALSVVPKVLLADAAPALTALLTIHPSQRGFAIAPDFLGLSYESAQLAHPEFFSVQNADFAGYLSALNPNGVLRIGGNTSGYAFWAPHHPQAANGGSTVPESVGPDTGGPLSTFTQTTPQAIRNLREFLDRIQWRCIYGLNFAKGTPEQAAEEAAAVSAILGDRLICFQFGNEVDNFAKKGLRPVGYNYSAFAVEWANFYHAVNARVPNVKVAGPDSASTGAWIREFAEQFGKEVMMLTTHYYAEGPPSDPSMTIERLLNPANPRWDTGIPNIREAMAESHLPFRLTETNSCFHGGKPGVSNTFASSLWALDLMFQLVQLGGSGINFHGGGYGWYTPVAGTMENGFVARPEYYAMLLFSQLLGGHVVSSHLDAPEAATDSSPALVCYALQNASGKLQAVVINKSATASYKMTVQANAAAERILLQRLIAPSLEDQADVTFAGAPVGMRGAWRAERNEHVNLKNGAAICFIPAASAALLTWES
jgi:hypothetical protein